MKRYLSKGFISIEVIGTLIVLLSAIGIGFQWVERDSSTKENQAAATHAKQVIQAAAQFIKNNNSTVLAAANPTVTYTMSDIAAYLPQNLASTNSYQQSYSIRVYKNGSGKLETMVVTTGGNAMTDRDAREISQLIGGSGGYISSSSTSQVSGSFGGWTMAFTNYGTSPGAGHIAGALFFDDGVDQSTDFLYRSAVSGHPEYNAMNTTLNMNGKDISGAGTIAATNLNVSQNIVTSGETYTGGWFRSTGAGAGGWYNQTFNGGLYMSDSTWVRSYANKSIYTGGTIEAGTLQNDGYLYSYGRHLTAHNDWAMTSYDSAWGANAAPQSAVGSLYVNDAYFRSAGKWASQLGGDTANLNTIGHTTLSSGLIFAWGYYPYGIPNNNSYTQVWFDQAFPHAVFNCMITPGWTGLSNDNGPLTVAGCTTSGMTAFNTSDAVPVNGFYWTAIGW